MFWQESEIPKWKTNIAGEYIDKILSEEENLITKQIDESLSILKKETEDNSLTKKVKKSLQDFLISNWLFAPFKWIFSRQLLSEDSQKKIEQAQKDLGDSYTEQEARQKLWLDWPIAMPTKNSKQSTNQEEKQEQQEKIENLNVKEQYIVNQAKKYWITDKKQIAYILSTVKGECWFKNIKEVWWLNRRYWKKDIQTWQSYYGRGFIQLTHKWNYEKFTNIIKEKNLKFKDNLGKELTLSQIDLVQNPDTILKSDELASFILIDGMKRWLFTWKKLSDFINNKNVDFYNARSIVNSINSSPDKFSNRAKEYLRKIDNKKLNNNILVGPNILAQNPEEFWWLWNSIMTWFQWYYNKKNFKNMNWVEWKSTRTHPNRFKSKEDVKKRKQNHPWVKSFVMYFGANTIKNKETLNDLEQRSNRLKEQEIQPVLCTCIWADNNSHLNDLNPKILELWKKLDTPVLDFASQYAQDKSFFAMWKNNHPDGKWYNFMKDQILSA